MHESNQSSAGLARKRFGIPVFTAIVMGVRAMDVRLLLRGIALGHRLGCLKGSGDHGRASVASRGGGVEKSTKWHAVKLWAALCHGKYR